MKEIRVQGTSRETPAAIDLLPFGMRVSKTLGLRGRGGFLDSARVVAHVPLPSLSLFLARIIIAAQLEKEREERVVQVVSLARVEIRARAR